MWWRFLQGPAAEEFAGMWLRRGFPEWREEGELLQDLSAYVRLHLMTHVQAAGLRDELRFLVGSLDWLQALLAPGTFGWPALVARARAAASASVSTTPAGKAPPRTLSMTTGASGSAAVASSTPPTSDNAGNLRWLLDELGSAARFLHPEAAGSVELRATALVRCFAPW